MRAKRNFYKITSELVEKMESMRREGATFKFIAEELGINQSTVYAHVKNEDSGFSKSKYIVILEGIKAGKTDEEIIKDAKTAITYLRQVKSYEVNRKKEAEEAEEKELSNQKEKEEKSHRNKKIGERREEVKKLMEEVERQKKKQEKEWEEEKNREIEYQVERYPYAFK